MMERWTLPEGWEWKRLGSIAQVIMGQSPPGNTYNDSRNGLPFFQGKADFGEIQPITRKWCTKPTKISEVGDVLISVRAPVGPVNLTAEKCIIGRGLAAIRPETNIETKYLFYVLRSFENLIESMGTGSTFHAISKQNLQLFEIPLPYPDDPERSLAEQRRIVARLEALLGEVKAMRQQVEAMQQDINRLMESALAEVFPSQGQPLPEGWEWVKVGKIANDTTRRNPESEPDKPFQYIDIAAVDNQDFMIVPERVKTLLGKDAPSRARKVIHAQNTILATTRPYLKNIALVTEQFDNQICSTGFCVLCPIPERIDYRYLYHAVKADSFIKQLIPLQRGANYPAVSDGDVFACEIPIPYPDDPAHSLAEQRRIVAYLESIQQEVQEAQKLIQSDLRAIEQLEQSILAAAFRGEL